MLICLHPRSSVLWYLRILIKVRFTFLQERLTSFLCLIKEVVEHRGVAGQLLDACLAVEFGIQSALDHAQGYRTMLHHLLSPADALVL